MAAWFIETLVEIKEVKTNCMMLDRAIPFVQLPRQVREANLKFPWRELLMTVSQPLGRRIVSPRGCSRGFALGQVSSDAHATAGCIDDGSAVVNRVTVDLMGFP